MLVKRIILLFFVLFLSSSYNSQGLQSERIPQAESASAEAAAIPPLDEKKAVELYEQALSEFIEFWYGDLGCEDEQLERSMIVDGKLYHQFCSKMDSMEKIKTKLGNVFSDVMVEYLIQSHGVTTINGKLVFKESDIGRMGDWERATAALVADLGNRRVFTLLIPIYDEPEESGFSDIVECVYEHSSWKLNMIP
ncbi:DL-endopeptidase inhibitor IseA family protein [Paenibacillus elgii]|nr:DL-endopeptidase inhibitor IseA family protein [Paenibacillus elgii]